MALNLAQNENIKKGVIIPFTRPAPKSDLHACIFCGKKVHIHKFRGKSVCYTCLQHIPSIFIG